MTTNTAFKLDSFANSDGLKPLALTDRSQYQLAMENGQQIGFGYSLAGLLAYAKTGYSELWSDFDDGSVCVYRLSQSKSGQKLDLLLAPAPMNTAVLKRALERANDFNGNKKARVLKIDANDVTSVSSLKNLATRERKSQYIYATDNFASLSGNRFRNVRRYVNKIQSTPHLQVKPYTHDMETACLELLSEWRSYHVDKHATKGGVGKTRRLLSLCKQMTTPDLFGEVIYIQDKLVGFALGGDIRSGVTAFLEAKCSPQIPGLAYFQRYRFMSSLQESTLINDGPDVGRAGLAQLKNSMRPINMHTEFSATQQN